ncbi:MAG: hypothetical protein ACRDTV_22160, partial [Mycobacterium sp.]
MSSPLMIASDAVSLAAQLTVRLRPMFAEPVILVDPSDPVIGGSQCIVAACERLAVLEGTCSAHHQRWIDDGRPEIETWAATVPALRRWLQQPRKCAVTTCRRGRRQLDLCHSHAVRWNSQGRPDLESWIEGGGGAPLPSGKCCQFPGCE